jgi:hypothetical protein
MTSRENSESPWRVAESGARRADDTIVGDEDVVHRDRSTAERLEAGFIETL